MVVLLYKMNLNDLISFPSSIRLKDLEEQRGLLSEAARALQSQEEKQKERMTSIRQQLAEEQVALFNFHLFLWLILCACFCCSYFFCF